MCSLTKSPGAAEESEGAAEMGECELQVGGLANSSCDMSMQMPTYPIFASPLALVTDG